MKKKQFKGKLSLNKETVSKLQDSQMSKIVGASDRLCQDSVYGPCTLEPNLPSKAVVCCTEQVCSNFCC